MLWVKSFLASIFGMSKMQAGILATLGIVGSFVTYLIGGWDRSVETLVIMMAIDCVTGMMVAGISKRSGKSESGALDSRATYKGIMKKIAILLSVVACAAIDRFFGGDAFFRDASVISWIGHEVLSITENTALLGAPWPAKLLESLEQIREKR